MYYINFEAKAASKLKKKKLSKLAVQVNLFAQLAAEQKSSDESQALCRVQTLIKKKSFFKHFNSNLPKKRKKKERNNIVQ